MQQHDAVTVTSPCSEDDDEDDGEELAGVDLKVQRWSVSSFGCLPTFCLCGSCRRRRHTSCQWEQWKLPLVTAPTRPSCL